MGLLLLECDNGGGGDDGADTIIGIMPCGVAIIITGCPGCCSCCCCWEY